MAASTTDLLKKYKSLFSTTLSTGIGTGTGDTITPASVSGLPTDTLITLTFDRVDSGGSATPTKLERIQGIISGGNFTSYTRGVDGTTEQAHAGGAVIEMIWNADDWNDLVTWGLTEHNQLGGHTNITASNITASGVSTLASLTSNSIYKSTIKSSVSEVLTTAGGTTAYTLTPSVAIDSYVTGTEFNIKMNATNTGASTINISGLGAKSLTKGGATALASGDLLINALYKITYDGTQFQVSGIGGSSATVATQAEVAAGTDNTKMVTPLGISRWHMPPQGFLYNGKIVPSASGGALTVALKTLAGTDPSASDPVYVRIGDTVRTISAALSFTVAAAANTFNAGSAELATKEIDLFVYLFYSTSSNAVGIGLSRVPYFTVMNNSGTRANELFMDTNIGYNATDTCEVVGRFAATLSAGAGYTWTVPSFTTTNLIQRPIYSTRWLTLTPVYTGFSANPSGSNIRYKLDTQTVTLIKDVYGSSGTSNAGTFTIVLPFTSAATFLTSGSLFVSDNGSNQTTPGHYLITASSNSWQIFKSWYSAAFTSSGTKNAWGSAIYEI